MLLHPAVIALLASSALITGLVLYASRIGITILIRWDLASGSEHQLELERKTYLVSTILANAFAFQLASLFLFVFTADRLHDQFIGAMCAAGTLYANPWGYPTLLLKIVTFALAGLWLILNWADTRAYDYPLVRAKYLLLLVLAPLLLAELVAQGNYLLRLEPNVITSCCGSLFSSDAGAVSSDIAGLPIGPTRIAFYAGVGLTCLSGLYFYLRGSGAYVFSLLSGSTAVLALASVISFISLYIYELPTHHCPFDILQAEYGFVGYPMYATLAAATLAGLGVGALMPFRKIGSLRVLVPDTQRMLSLVATILFFLFSLVVTYRMATSGLVLG
jgi:hypothetical protein